MNRNRFVKDINNVLELLLSLNFKVTSRGGVKEENVSIFRSIKLSELKESLPSAKEIDNILIVLRANEHIIYEDVKNTDILLTPKGADAFLADTYKERYYRFGKAKIDFWLKWLPLFTVWVTISLFIIKELTSANKNKCQCTNTECIKTEYIILKEPKKQQFEQGAKKRNQKNHQPNQ